MDSSYLYTPANVNALVVNENNTVMNDVEKRNVVEIDIVVMFGYHHDCESETSMIGARQDGQSNVLLLCAECSAETDSAVESNDASETDCV